MTPLAKTHRPLPLSLPGWLDSRYLLVITLLCGLAGGVLIVVQAGLVSRVIAAVFLDGAGLEAVSRPMAALLVVFLLRAGATLGAESSAGLLAVDVKTRLRELLHEKLLALGPAYAREARTGELVTTITGGIEALDAYFSQFLPQIGLAALLPLTILAAVFPQDALSGVVLLVTAPLIPLFMMLIGSTAETLTRRQWTALSTLAAHFLDTLQGLVTLKLLGRSQAREAGIARQSEHYRQVTMQVLRVTFLSALALELVATLSTAVVAVQIGLRLLAGGIGYREALFILMLAPEFYQPLRQLGLRFHAGMAGVSAARRILEVLAAQPEAPGQRVEVVGGAESTPARPPALSFERVSYAFDGGERGALDEVSFDVRAGERVALVGISGAGKSTLLSLVLGFIEPHKGLIRVDGVDLRAIPVDDWRRRVAWVPQNPYLFNASLLDNLLFGSPGASMSAVERAARLARLEDVVAGLPQGYATPIGEQGARLSGGQAQRVALARAFLRADATLLLLDEPAASLDPLQAAELQQSLDALAQGRTTLVIAHRLATAARADRVVVLASGRVVEAGPPADLLARNGAYSQMVAAYGR